MLRIKALQYMRLSIIFALLCSFFVGVKILLFWQFEYTSDLFSFLAMSRSWLEGQSFLYEPAYGSHIQIHHYFLVLVFGIFTKFFGAYAFFVIHGLLLFLTAWVLRKTFDPSKFFWAFYWGPVSFWIFDNPTYGWHLELLYLPLGLLFLAALKSSSNWKIFISFILLLAVREDAALIALGLIWIFWFSSDLVSRSFLRRKIFVLALLAISFFIVQFSILRGGRATQLNFSFEQFSLLKPMLGQALILLLPVFFVFRISWKSCALPLLLVIPPLILSGFIYSGYEVWHGLTWPPRFVLVWTLVMAGALFSELRVQKKVWLLVILILPVIFLNFVRNYNLFHRLQIASGLGAQVLTQKESQLVSCLAKKLNPREAVVVVGSLNASFHQQTLLWPDRNLGQTQTAAFVLCDLNKRLVGWESCLKAQESLVPLSWKTFEIENLKIQIQESHVDRFHPCLKL